MCITNHVLDLALILYLIQICLKGDARAWYKAYEEELQRVELPLPLNLDNLKKALMEEFVREEVPKKVWQDVQETIQKEEEPIGEYILRFSSLWEDLYRALHPQVLPKTIKKDCFMTRLKTSLYLRVELKKLRSYEDAVDAAKRKEWKYVK